MDALFLGVLRHVFFCVVYIPVITILKRVQMKINTIFGRFFRVPTNVYFPLYFLTYKKSLHFNIYMLNSPYFVNLKNVFFRIFSFKI